MDKMTDKRVEAIARAIAIDRVQRKLHPSLFRVDAVEPSVADIQAAQAAISADPVTSTTNWIETVLLPELEDAISRTRAHGNIVAPQALEDIKQFILSRKDEWKGK